MQHGVNDREADVVRLVQEAIEAHGARPEAVIPILSEVNRALGYIPTSALPEIRRRINLSGEGVFLADSHLYSAASFYELFSLRPLGKHVVRFCESAPCHVMGGRQVIQELQDRLGLRPGETTPDGKWSLIATSCLGVCGVGPVLTVDDEPYGNVTPRRIPEILARYRDPDEDQADWDGKR